MDPTLRVLSSGQGDIPPCSHRDHSCPDKGSTHHRHRLPVVGRSHLSPFEDESVLRTSGEHLDVLDQTPGQMFCSDEFDDQFVFLRDLDVQVGHNCGFDDKTEKSTRISLDTMVPVRTHVECVPTYASCNRSVAVRRPCARPCRFGFSGHFALRTSPYHQQVRSPIIRSRRHVSCSTRLR